MPSQGALLRVAAPPMRGVMTLNDRSGPRSADSLGEQGGGRDQVRFAREGEAEQERRRGRRVGGAVAVQLVQADAGVGGGGAPRGGPCGLWGAAGRAGAPD